MKYESYFAYGSNLHPLRLRERVSTARLVCTGILHHHRLSFHKRGDDGSGKCDCPFTGSDRDRVHGALFVFDASEKPLLDACEGQGYACRNVAVHTATGTVRAYTYQAEEIDTSLSPYQWYKDLVLAGARHLGLHRDYVGRIAAVRAIPDPEARRVTHHAALLMRIRAWGARGR